MAQATSAVAARRSRSATARHRWASMPSVPLSSDRPSLASRVTGSSPAAARPSAPGSRRPSAVMTSPDPTSTAPTWARGARSPEAPRLPSSGTTGVSPALTRATSRSARTGRAPDRPAASVRARSSIMARTTSGSTRSPIPAAWLRTSDSWRRLASSADTFTEASAPNPVVTPETVEPSATIRSTTARAGAMRSLASGASVTVAPWRATATTSATESGEPSRTTADGPTAPGGGVTVAPPGLLPDRSDGVVLGGLDHGHLAGRVDVDRHRHAVLARFRVAPRSEQPRPGRVERHGEGPGFRGNLQAVVRLPVALESWGVDARLFRDPPEAHPLGIEEPDAVAGIDSLHCDTPVLEHPGPRAPG